MRVADIAIERGDPQPIGGGRRLGDGAVTAQGHVRAARELIEPPREREVLALRTAWNIKSGYEWARHVVFARRAGLHDDEIEALKRSVTDGPVRWSEPDVALIAMADMLVKDYYVSDDAWKQLSKHFDDKQCMDAIFVVGHFVLLGMFLNTAGVPIDPDVKSDPELDVSGS